MPSISTRDEGSVRILTFERPDVRNALSGAMRDELLAALEATEADSSVRVLVITGRGPAFCAGMDLAELESLLDRGLEEHLLDSQRMADLFRRLYTFPKPVVAALNGHAIAGGAGLASLCDLVIASEDARIGYSEVRVGFVAALVGVYLVRMVGERAARELLLEGRSISSGRAREYGLVSEVVPAGVVMERALERARSMAECGPQALAITKRLLTETAELPLSQAIESAIAVNARTRMNEEMREGVRAFLEKRPPAWREREG